MQVTHCLWSAIAAAVRPTCQSWAETCWVTSPYAFANWPWAPSVCGEAPILFDNEVSVSDDPDNPAAASNGAGENNA